MTQEIQKLVESLADMYKTFDAIKVVEWLEKEIKKLVEKYR